LQSQLLYYNKRLNLFSQLLMIVDLHKKVTFNLNYERTRDISGDPDETFFVAVSLIVWLEVSAFKR
jgi:hypothetical protein